MIFIIANVLNSARSDSISFCELEVPLGLQCSHIFTSQMASEVQNPLAKMDFLLVCG